MPYDFMNLSPDEFENLARDLLSAEWGAQVEAFKSGRDQGVDLRFTKKPLITGTAIIQCKRFRPDRFNVLLETMRAEALKVAHFKPAQYILITSVPLSPHNKEQLLAAMAPWCKSTQDILGPSELNGMLNRHQEIENAHFKLWISGTAVIEQILHAGIFNITADTLEALAQQMSRLVVHPGLERALEILKNQHHVLIVGNPGIGKTTLARMLMCHYIKEGFTPLTPVSNIGESWEAISRAIKENQKVVILYDDFLGQIRFDDAKFDKNEERSLLQLLDRCRRHSNIRLVLTTREYILADARRLHGVFDQGADRIEKCVLSIGDYSLLSRAKVLFNHLYFSDLPNSRLQLFVQSKIYKQIAAHKHFNPRIVEGISIAANSASLNDENFLHYVMQEFSDPSRVWDHPFKNQISPTSRLLLIALWSFGGSSELEELKEMVRFLTSTQSAQDLLINFEHSLRELDGNFIQSDRTSVANVENKFVLILRFQNPSVREYLENFVTTNTDRLSDVIKNVQNFEQISYIFLLAVSEKGKLFLNKAQWASLLDASLRTLNKKRGRLSYSAYDNRRVYFADEVFVASDRILTIAKISKQAFPDKRLPDRICDLLLSEAGWKKILQRIPHNNSESYSARALFDWLQSDSGLTEEELIVAGSSFSTAAQILLSAQEINYFSSIYHLANVIARTTDNLTEVEQAAIESAIQEATESALQSDDPGDLESELEYLDELGKSYRIDISFAKEQVQEHIEYLRKEEIHEEDSDDDNYRYGHESSEPFEIDSMFSLLVDR